MKKRNYFQYTFSGGSLGLLVVIIFTGLLWCSILYLVGDAWLITYMIDLVVGLSVAHLIINYLNWKKYRDFNKNNHTP